MSLRRIGTATLIVAVAVLAIAAWWRGTAPSRPTPSVTELAPISSASVPILNYAPPADSWPSYASRGLGFSMRYPDGWVSASCGSGCVAWAPIGSKPEIGITAIAGTLVDVLARLPSAVASSTPDIGPVAWRRLTMRIEQTGGLLHSHFAERNGLVVEFGTNSTDAAVLDAYGSMVRSFRFTQ